MNRLIAKAARKAAQRQSIDNPRHALYALAEEIDGLVEEEIARCAQAPSGLNRQERGYFAALEKRAQHLNTRITEAHAARRDLTYEKKELAALVWVLDMIRAAHPPWRCVCGWTAGPGRETEAEHRAGCSGCDGVRGRDDHV